MIISAILLMVSICTLSAQQVSTNKKGDLIITFRDGSWRPVKPSDSLLVREYLLQNPGTKSTKNKAQTKTAASTEENKTAVSSPPINPSETTPSAEPGSLQSKWDELAYSILEEEKVVQKEFRDATNAQFKAAEELKMVKGDKKSADPSEVSVLQKEYDTSVAHLREAKLKQNEIKKLVDATRTVTSNPDILNEKKYKKTLASYNSYQAEHDSNHEPSEVVPAAVITSNAAEPAGTTTTPRADPTPTTPAPQTGDSKKTATGDDFTKRPHDPKKEAYRTKPYACVFITDSIDHSGTKRIELQPEIFLTYTDPDLRPYFRDKEMITGRGMMSKVGPFFYLSVEFQIAGSHAQNNFGTLQEGSLLSIKLINGESVSLYNLKTHTGRIDAYTGNTIYTGQYAIGKQELKKLGAAEMDSIRVLWSTGYEDYEVFKVDFLSHQIQCLLSKK